MTHVVTESCIQCKYGDCIEVCPVDCFYEGANMVVINPDECIDCGVCVPECPVDAIIPDTADGAARWVEFNRTYASIWPQIKMKNAPLNDADSFKDTPNKLADCFDPSPGRGR